MISLDRAGVFWIRQEPDFQRRNLVSVSGTLVAVVLIPYMLVLAL